MEVRLFGELEAVAAGMPVPVRGAKQRALLALPALQRGQPVSADRLIDVLWGDGQAANPASPRVGDATAVLRNRLDCRQPHR
jgi:DNA-binding SARP family transcriptional activator